MITRGCGREGGRNEGLCKSPGCQGGGGGAWCQGRRSELLLRANGSTSPTVSDANSAVSQLAGEA